MFSNAGAAHQWISSITTTGAVTLSQPAAADITGLGYFATGTDAANLTGTINNARLSAIPNSALANSSITISGHVVALGGSLALASGDVSGLGTFATQNYATPPAIGGTTPAAGAFTTLSASSGLAGVATASNAAAGCVGEYISSTVAAGSATPLTNGTPLNITSISLTAGDWDVSGVVGFSYGATTNVADEYANISATSGDVGYGSTTANIRAYSPSGVVPGGLNASLPITPVRFSIASTTTIFLVTEVNFSTSTAAAFGTIRARRMR